MENLGPLILLILTVVLLGPLLLRTRRQQREFAAAQAEIEVGRRVMMTSGVFGDIVSVADDTVEVEVAPGVRTTWARPAVARVLPSEIGEQQQPPHEPPHEQQD